MSSLTGSMSFVGISFTHYIPTGDHKLYLMVAGSALDQGGDILSHTWSRRQPGTVSWRDDWTGRHDGSVTPPADEDESHTPSSDASKDGRFAEKHVKVDKQNPWLNKRQTQTFIFFSLSVWFLIFSTESEDCDGNDNSNNSIDKSGGSEILLLLWVVIYYQWLNPTRRHFPSRRLSGWVIRLVIVELLPNSSPLMSAVASSPHTSGAALDSGPEWYRAPC